MLTKHDAAHADIMSTIISESIIPSRANDKFDNTIIAHKTKIGQPTKIEQPTMHPLQMSCHMTLHGEGFLADGTRVWTHSAVDTRMPFQIILSREVFVTNQTYIHLLAFPLVINRLNCVVTFRRRMDKYMLFQRLGFHKSFGTDVAPVL